jgi:dephospho-CoA kinase/inosine/xanthosine triphosphate pyrophosphatase family protein
MKFALQKLIILVELFPMIELFFLTTNRVKFDHLKYLLKEQEISLKPYRDYGRPYDEPHISDRERLLISSLQDANKRLHKTNVKSSLDLELALYLEEESPKNIKADIGLREKLASLFQDRLFIIEDTSVKIDALSTDDAEFPGVDVKFWMKETSFDELDALLKKHDNNRKVTVRSDIVLYLPKNFRSILDTEFYKVFTGISGGKIVDSEFSIKTDPMYPWLDGRTFNKWFVPESENVPISMLPITSATNHDFRRKAIDGLVEFLRKLNLISEAQKYSNSPPSQTTIFNSPSFVVCGPSCAGKTVLAEHLVNKYGYYHIEASDFMHREFYSKHGTKSEVSIHEFASRALKDDPQIVSRQIINHLEEIQSQNVIISGFRSPLEIEPLRTSKSQYEFCYIKADQKIRFERNRARARNDAAKDEESFKRRDELQFSMGLDEIEGLHFFDKIINETDLPHYLGVFSKKHLAGAPTVSKIEENFLPKDKTNLFLNLEESVLVSLLIESRKEDEYYTTTEIASKINKYVKDYRIGSSGEKIVTNKNNVSRFFNQKFYPYFEIISFNGINKFRLSTTGRSRAMSVIRKHLTN